MKTKMSLTSSKAQFFNALKKSPYTSALILANWWYFYEHKSTTQVDKEKILDLINEVTGKIADEDFLKIWDSVVDIPDAEFQIKEKTTRKTITILKHRLIKDINWLLTIPEDRLVALGEDQEYTLEIIIGLIRKNLICSSQVDVFKYYDYIDIMKFDQEQSLFEVTGYIKKCASLPIEALIKLGKSSAEVAKIVMRYVSVHEQGFEIVGYYAAIHESIRDVIFQNWKTSIESLGYDDEMSQTIKQQAAILRGTYPQFQEIEAAEYLKKLQQSSGEDRLPFTCSMLALNACCFGLKFFLRRGPIPGGKYIAEVIDNSLITPAVITAAAFGCQSGYSLYQFRKNAR